MHIQRGQLLGQHPAQPRVAQRLAVLQRKIIQRACAGHLAHSGGHERGLQPGRRKHAHAGLRLVADLVEHAPNQRRGGDGGGPPRRSAPLSSNPLAISRTKKPRFLRASTRPCASNWSYAATTVEGLTPCCCAHCRTEGRRAPGASSRLRMRSPKRADSCSVSDWVVVFISMAVSLCTVIAANTDHELRCLTVLVVY